MVQTTTALNPKPFLVFRLVPFIGGKNKHPYDSNPPYRSPGCLGSDAEFLGKRMLKTWRGVTGANKLQRR